MKLDKCPFTASRISIENLNILNGRINSYDNAEKIVRRLSVNVLLPEKLKKMS